MGSAFQTVVSEDGDRNSAFFLQYSRYHLVGVRDVAASTMTIYVDGVKAGSIDVLGGADRDTGALAVGRGKFGGKPVDYLGGGIDEVHAYNRALSAPEVKQTYAAVPPPG